MDIKEFWNDTRGQPIAISRFFLSLIVGGILFMVILTPVATPILAGSLEATDNQEANQATMWFQELVEFTPIIILFVCVFGLIIVAIMQRGRLQ